MTTIRSHPGFFSGRQLNSLSVWALYAAGLVPAAWYFYLGAVNELGADPVKTFEHLLGIWALRFILLSLCITPMRDLFSVNLLRYRRALGLLGFYYVCFHFLVYLLLDQQMNLGAVVEDVVKRPFITFGMMSLLLLLPLAVTSNSWSIRKLGRHWQQLHRLVYPIAALGTLHFAMSRKVIGPEIACYVAVAVLVLGYRLLRPRILEWRRQQRQRSQEASVPQH